MKTNDELERAIQNLIDRMNRIEAKVTHFCPRPAVTDKQVKSAVEWLEARSALTSAVDEAVSYLDRAAATLVSRLPGRADNK